VETTAHPKKANRGVFSGKRQIAGVLVMLFLKATAKAGKVSVSLRLSREKFIYYI